MAEAGAGGQSPRFYDLDALRAVAMFLGVVLHSSIFVLPEAAAIWPIQDPAARGDSTYKVLTETIHGFRMPVFFLLSGFFSALLWQRRSLRALVMQRLRRVGLPLAVGAVTVVPLSIWILAAAGGYREPYDFPLWILPLVWIFGLAHLWFLWYLLLMAGGFALAVRLGLQFRHTPFWWLVIPISMAISLVMVEPIYGADNATGIIPGPAIIAYYACFFIFGVFFYRRGFTIRRWWTVALLPAAGAFFAGFYLLGLYLEPYEAALPPGEPPSEYLSHVPEAFMFQNPLTLAAALIGAVCAWLMCFGLMGLFRWAASRESFTVRYLSDASYWMYLAHLPVVMVAQYLVLYLPIHYHIKFLIVCVAATAFLVATYQLGVRYTFIGRALNGPRTRRQPALPGQPQPANPE